MAEPGKRVVAQWRRWALANLGPFAALFTNSGSAWLILAPVVSLVATYAPRRLFWTYFNLFLRRRARLLLNAVDPYVTIDISEPGGEVRYSRYGPVSDTDSTYEEVKVYLSGAARSQDARELRAEGARVGDGLVVSVRDGQDVADEFRGVPLWWSSVVARDVQGQRRDDRRFQRLTFHLRHRALVVDEYLPHVRRRGREILFSNRRRRPRDSVTLSGLLNFIDGLWSACTGERIVVFTPNHAEKLDPALIRRGRMDMHVEMSYCKFEAFQTLARNYLGIDDHELFGAVGEILREENLTPADVAECLMAARRAGSGEPSPCLEILIDELKKRAVEKAKA